jgi:CelD/BcsL family acetyltransferase involved in cellulose biosynthesis
MLRRSNYQAPFHTWGWHDTWWTCFGHGRDLYLVTGEDPDGQLQIVAPLMRRRRRKHGLPLLEVRFLANHNNPFNTIIHRRDISASEALSYVLTCLTDHCQDWHFITLRNLPTRQLNQDCMTAAATPLGLRVIYEPGWSSAYLTIDDSFDEYIAGQFGKQRLRGIQQKVRQLSQQTQYRLNEYRAPEAMAIAVEQAFAVSANSWKKSAGTDMSGAEDMRRFYEEVSPRLANSGHIRIWISSLGPTPLALQYNLVSADTMYLLINDFNEAYRRQSPGTVLLYQVLSQLHREHSVSRFQFSGDLYDYKSHWATGIEKHFTTTLYHRGLYSRALWFAKGTLAPVIQSLQTRLKRVPNDPHKES